MLVSEESRGFSGLEYSDFVSKGQSAKSSNPMVKSRGGGKALLSMKAVQCPIPAETSASARSYCKKRILLHEFQN